MGWLSAAKLVGWVAGKTGLKDVAVKCILIGIVAAALAFGAWRAWSWIDGMRDTIASQKAEISGKDQEIGGLRIQLDLAVQTANDNAAQLTAEQLLHQALLDRLTQLRRDAQIRESRLQEAIDAILKWPPGADGDIGPGLRGVLGGMRGQAAGAAPADHPGAADMRDGAGLSVRLPRPGDPRP